MSMSKEQAWEVLKEAANDMADDAEERGIRLISRNGEKYADLIREALSLLSGLTPYWSKWTVGAEVWWVRRNDVIGTWVCEPEIVNGVVFSAAACIVVAKHSSLWIANPETCLYATKEEADAELSRRNSEQERKEP